LMTVNNQLRLVTTQLQTVAGQLDQFTEQQDQSRSAVQTILQWLKQWHTVFADMRANIEHISITSQVVATRSNQLEWRSFLKFHSQWHNESLLATYSRWQKQQCRAPCPPANQWSCWGDGSPLSPMDSARLASQHSCSSPHWLKLETVNQYLSFANENLKAMELQLEGTDQWSAAKKTAVHAWASKSAEFQLELQEHQCFEHRAAGDELLVEFSEKWYKLIMSDQYSSAWDNLDSLQVKSKKKQQE